MRFLLRLTYKKIYRHKSRPLKVLMLLFLAFYGLIVLFLLLLFYFLLSFSFFLVSTKKVK